MNEQYKPSDFVESTDDYTSRPVDKLDPFIEKVPEDVVLFHETPLGGSAAADSPTYETSVQEVPIEGTPAVVDPVDETIVHEAPMGETSPHEVLIGKNTGLSTALLSGEESEHFRTRWNEIQGMFVDEPRAAVQQADALVTEVIEQVTQMFANEHSSLEAQWKQGNDVSTEDLRKALQVYRSFFNRLVV